MHGMKTSRKKYQSWLYRMGGISHIVTVSESARRMVARSSGVSPERVTNIPNGIETEAFQKEIDRKRKRAEIGVDESVRLIGIVARLSPEKDHETLFEAFSQLSGEFGEVHLVVVGGGELQEQLSAAARRLAIESRVHFLGYRSDVAELLAIFDCFVLSSRSEGLSITLLEAMAAGLPIVATDVGGNGEVIQNEETGLLVPPAQPSRLAAALKRMLTDGEAARRMGERGSARVREHFSLDKMVAGYERIYDELLRGVV
jgi:glycosyltransferase involved in cell wall biosynthesis